MFKHTFKRFKITITKGFDEKAHKTRYQRLAVLNVENLNPLVDVDGRGGI